MNDVLKILKQKPTWNIGIALGYVLFIIFVKWGITLHINMLLFGIGSLLGIYFLEGAEAFFHLNPSPFRTIVFVMLCTLVSIFVVTSSGSLLGSGLVLMLSLQLLLSLGVEWQARGSIASWFQMTRLSPSIAVQQGIIVVLFVLFCFQTILFFR